MIEAILKPVRKRSVSDAAHDQLRDAILTGKLPPGSTLPAERALCDTFQVNRGAVREALGRLEQSRLVTLDPRGARRVLDFRESARLDLVSGLLFDASGELDRHVARSILELRSALLPDCARLAARRGGAAVADELDAQIDRMKGAEGEAARRAEEADGFLQVLARSGGNVAYSLVFNTIREVCGRVRAVSRARGDKSAGDFAVWEAIARAVRRRDAEAARRVGQKLAASLSRTIPR